MTFVKWWKSAPNGCIITWVSRTNVPIEELYEAVEKVVSFNGLAMR